MSRRNGSPREDIRNPRRSANLTLALRSTQQSSHLRAASRGSRSRHIPPLGLARRSPLNACACAASLFEHFEGAASPYRAGARIVPILAFLGPRRLPSVGARRLRPDDDEGELVSRASPARPWRVAACGGGDELWCVRLRTAHYHRLVPPHRLLFHSRRASLGHRHGRGTKRRKCLY